MADDRVGCEFTLKLGQYDLVGISSNLDSFFEAARLACLAKSVNPEALVVAGGAFATVCPRLHLEHGFDAAIIGEGEITFPDLVKGISKGRALKDILGLAIPDQPFFTGHRPFLSNLDKSVPAYDLFNIKAYITRTSFGGLRGLRQMFVITSRGCSQVVCCSFCNAHYLSPRVIEKKLNLVIQEIQLLKDKYGVQAINFGDANFIADHVKVIQLSQQLKNIDIPWSCFSRADTLKDKKLLGLMREGGCREISMGLESANPATLIKTGKNIRLENVKAGINNCRQAGIKPVIMVILGLPEETERGLEQMIKFLQKEKVAVIPNFLYPIPDTALYQEAKTDGRLPDLEELLRRVEEYNYTSREKLIFNLSAVSDDLLISMMKKLKGLNQTSC